MESEEVRIVQLSDIDAGIIKQLVTLDQQAVEKYGKSYSNEAWKISNFVYELPNKNKYSYILIVDNIIIGFCIASLRNESIYIHRLLVKKNKDNLAKVFFRELLIKYANKNVLLMVNEHNDNAINFYKYFDFRLLNDKKIIEKFISKELSVENNTIKIEGDYTCYLMIKEKY